MRSRLAECLGALCAVACLTSGEVFASDSPGGLELGLRPSLGAGLRTSVSLWWLDVDSALGSFAEPGAVEPSRPVRGFGAEVSASWAQAEWLVLDAGAALTHARFRDDDPAKDSVSASPVAELGAGVTLRGPASLFAGMRASYLSGGPVLVGARGLAARRRVDADGRRVRLARQPRCR